MTAATGTVPTPHAQAVEPAAGQVGTGTDAPQARPRRSRRRRRPSRHPKLTGPASITSAPAKGAPTTAQIRRALVSLQAIKRRFQLEHVDTGGAVVDAADASARAAGTRASRRSTVRPLFGNGVACGGILHPWTLGVANKTLPCGTKVVFQYGSRAIEVRVIDRGPYIAGREWDLTAATAVALHFPGLGPDPLAPGAVGQAARIRRPAAAAGGSLREITFEIPSRAHRHAVQRVGRLHRALLVGDDDELRA